MVMHTSAHRHFWELRSGTASIVTGVSGVAQHGSGEAVNEPKHATEQCENSDEAAAEPRISVVMPVHNGGRFLDEAILSIRNQTLCQIELIIVENGSTDDSYQTATRHAAADPRVRVIKLAQGDLITALNHGIEAARAPWIARMDGDDVALPERLERQLAVLDEQPDIAVLGTYGWIISATGRQVGMFRAGPTTREEFQRAGRDELIYLLSPSVVFSREVALALGGFNHGYPTAGDVEFWSRIADGHLVLALPEPLVCYRIHAEAISTRRFDQQMRNARRAKLNLVRRRGGEREVSKEEFEEIERRQPMAARARRRLAVQSQYCYRRGGGLLAAGRYGGAFWLALSGVLYPPLPLRRLMRQRVFAIARAGVAARLVKPRWLPGITGGQHRAL